MRRGAVAPLIGTMLAVGAGGPVAAHQADGGDGSFTAAGGSARVLAEGAGAAVAGSTEPTPQAGCLPGSRTEPDLQGRVPASTVSAKGFTCNMRLVGREGSSGGFKVHRYVDPAGHECAYYDTTLLFPANARFLSDHPTGAAVLDMSNPRKPVRAGTLLTPAMQSPHESLVINQRRGLLVAVNANPIMGPGIVDVYSLRQDCRRPVLESSLPVGLVGHESGLSEDGRTFFATSLYTGQVTAVDLTNPKLPVPVWEGNYLTHGLTLSNDGNRAYLAERQQGLIVLDTSEIQARTLNPQVREVSRLSWDTLTIPQVAIPVTIRGRKYIVEIDEYSTNGAPSLFPAGNGNRVGAARIIDIEDERKPRVVSNMRLEVHEPENRAKVGGDPGANIATQGYAGHMCAVPKRKDPGIVACSFIASGLRVFDIRDPLKPEELAYYVAPHGLPAVATDGVPSNYAMSAPAFAPERGEIWYSDANTGFYVVRVEQGVWPFVDRSTGATCLARRSPIGRRSIGRVRVGATRRGMLRAVRPRPTRFAKLTLRWCVKRSSGRVTAVFGSRSRRSRARLVVTTATRHGMRGVRRGTRVGRFLGRFPKARKVSGRVYRAGPNSRRIFGVRRGRVRFVAVADAGLLRNPASLRRHLRRAGL